jgi:uncharacterized protein YegP (UPF0339 family)
MASRYQYFSHGDGWWWRLLGANNRVLARSAAPFATAEAARRDVETVAPLAPFGIIEVGVTSDGTWRWLLLDGSRVRALSSHGYARRMECLRAVDRFRSCATTAIRAEHDSLFGKARQNRRYV